MIPQSVNVLHCSAHDLSISFPFLVLPVTQTTPKSFLPDCDWIEASFFLLCKNGASAWSDFILPFPDRLCEISWFLLFADQVPASNPSITASRETVSEFIHVCIACDLCYFSAKPHEISVTYSLIKDGAFTINPDTSWYFRMSCRYRFPPLCMWIVMLMPRTSNDAFHLPILCSAILSFYVTPV